MIYLSTLPSFLSWKVMMQLYTLSMIELPLILAIELIDYANTIN